MKRWGAAGGVCGQQSIAMAHTILTAGRPVLRAAACCAHRSPACQAHIALLFMHTSALSLERFARCEGWGTYAGRAGLCILVTKRRSVARAQYPYPPPCFRVCPRAPERAYRSKAMPAA